MNNFAAGWTALDNRRKLIVIGATIAAIICMAAIWRMSGREDMALLYAGLEPATAGEVIASLEQSSVPFEVRGNAIYVSASQRDSTRLALAANGLPATGGMGYELLDTMTGFGTTAQMFDAAYWRAKEGELARTIVASPAIRAARVHIANPPRQAFSRNVPMTASVNLTPGVGGVEPAQADAIRFLVASAVPGLAPDQVAIIDSVNGVVLPAADSGPTADPGRLDQRSAQMKANIERLLAARVGPGNALVEVNIDADTDRQVITERVIDPASRVAISQDLEENTEQATGTGGGAVTVASNLPAGDAAQPGETSNSTRSETRERQNFEVSETRRERVIEPGQIRRITVAVILDGLVSTGPNGERSWSPRPEEEMQALRELVESAIGFDSARGDRVTLQTLEFPSPPVLGTEALDEGFALPGGNVLSLIQTAVLGLVALLLGLFVVRPLLLRPPVLPAPELLAETIDVTAALEDPVEAGPQSLPDANQSKIRNLRELVSERREDSADVLRRWIDAPETNEGAT
ncbi:MAG: flagellar basal-body MS-ring/collar protein FliF [Pseudomonadota bacterium]